MQQRVSFHRQVLWAFALPCLLAGWWGCAKGNDTQSGGSTALGTGGSGGAGGDGAGGQIGTAGGGGEGGSCTSTKKASRRVPLDLVFVIDQSHSMFGSKWKGLVSGLTDFWGDPASTGIGTGLILFPASTNDCDVTHYETLDVPIAPLPDNVASLVNVLPANPTIVGTPLYAALKGGLLLATAHRDQYPGHKVSVVVATDGDGEGCNGITIDDVAAVAKSALDYNGVRTYVIGLEDSIVPNLDQIAAAGGTKLAYDITQDISLFSAKMAQIRTIAIGCDFELPAPPDGKNLEPDKVNFTYTPGGKGNAFLFPRADDLASCANAPGWYYDDNEQPSEIILCPASCSTVENDADAKVDVEFGCSSILK